MQKLFAVAALIPAAASILSAQSSTTSAPTVAEIVAARVARLTKLLTLSTSQAATATSLFTVEVTAEQTIRTNLDAAHTALTTAIEANNSAGISTAAAMIGNLSAQEVLADATAQAGFYAILTSAQQAIYQAFVSGGPGGPGGFGGTGPGPGGPHH
jgi:hypothetical protein